MAVISVSLYERSSTNREFKESPFEQGEDEQVAFAITVPASWGSATLASLASVLYEDPDGDNTDVSSTKISGSTTASGQVITTGLVKSLTDGKKYRLDVKFTSSESNVLEAFAFIFAQR